jgi:hypothetical protein
LDLFGYASDGASAFRLRAASRPSGLLGSAALVRATRYGRHVQSRAPHAAGCLDASLPIRDNNPDVRAAFSMRPDVTPLYTESVPQIGAALREDAGPAGAVGEEWGPERGGRTSAAGG